MSDIKGISATLEAVTISYSVLEAKDKEIARLRAELDAINKSHADLAHRLADLGRENERLREAFRPFAAEGHPDSQGAFFHSRVLRKAREALASMPEAGTTMGRLGVRQGGTG